MLCRQSERCSVVVARARTRNTWRIGACRRLAQCDSADEHTLLPSYCQSAHTTALMRLVRCPGMHAYNCAPPPPQHTSHAKAASVRSRTGPCRHPRQAYLHRALQPGPERSRVRTDCAHARASGDQRTLSLHCMCPPRSDSICRGM